MLEGQRRRGLVHLLAVLHPARKDLSPHVLANDDEPLALLTEVDVLAMVQAAEERVAGVHLVGKLHSRCEDLVHRVDAEVLARTLASDFPVVAHQVLGEELPHLPGGRVFLADELV